MTKASETAASPVENSQSSGSRTRVVLSSVVGLIAAFGTMPGGVIGGHFGERYGRKKVLVTGMVLSRLLGKRRQPRGLYQDQHRHPAVLPPVDVARGDAGHCLAYPGLSDTDARLPLIAWQMAGALSGLAPLISANLLLAAGGPPHVMLTHPRSWW
jgi:MFS family permease